jgi:hypothetical protein
MPMNEKAYARWYEGMRSRSFAAQQALYDASIRSRSLAGRMYPAHVKPSERMGRTAPSAPSPSNNHRASPSPASVIWPNLK